MRMHVAICTPTAGLVTASYAVSMPFLITTFLTEPVIGREQEEKKIGYQMIISASIHQSRENMIEEALKNDCTHVLFVDDDMGFDRYCLNGALARQMPIVVGNYRRKAAPFRFTAVNKDENDTIVEIKTTEESRSLEECYYGGFGFTLIETEVLKAVKAPRFLPGWSEKYGTYTTEDFPFYKQAKEKGFTAFVDHDLSKKLRHQGQAHYTYNMDLPK